MPDLTPPTDAASINTPPDASYLIKGTELPTYDVNLDQTSKESGLSQEQIVQMGGMNPEQAVSDFTAATKGKVGLALSTFAGVKPEVATKVQTLADHYDTPYSFADKNQQDLQNSYEANSIYENLLEANPDGTLKHPMTAGWLSDPDKMIAAKDDVKAIQNIEDLTKEFHYKYDNDNFFNNLLLGIPGNVAAATVGAGEGIRDVAENADRVWNYNMARAFAPYFGLNDEETYKAEMAASQSVKEGFDAVLGSPTRDIEARKDWMQEASKGNFRPFVRSVGAGAPLMAAAVLQPELSPMLFGTTTFNSYFNRSMDRGDTEQAAMLNAGTQAIIAATLTPANLENNIVKALGAKGVGEMVTKTLAGSAGMEGIASLQEAVDFAYNNHSDISQLTDPKNVIDWVGRRIEGFFVNAALFGMMNGARGVQKQQDLHAMVDQAMNEMSTAKFATLKPELKNDLLGRVLTSAGVEDTAAVKATDVKTFFQDDPSGLGKFLERHQVDSEDFEDAVRNNGTVQTSASKLLASQEDAPLVARVGAGNIAIGEGGMTADEIQAKTKEIQSRIQELGDQVKDAKIGKRENPAWVEQTINTLMKSKAQGGEGWDAKTAAQSVLLLHHTLENFAQISGEDTGAMYKRLGIETKVDRSGRQLAEGEIAQPDKKTLGQKVIDALTGKKARGSIQITDGKTVINLFRKADLSTFLHESAHLISSEYQRLADGGFLQDANLENFNALKEYAGGKFDRDGEEKIARGFEKYLRTGEAPSKALIPAFRSYRKWLSSIYKDNADMGEEASPAVKGMFDRIIASENEVAEAKKFYATREEVKSKRAAKTDEQLASEVADKKREAEENAVEKELASRMKAFNEATGGKKEFVRQARSDIERKPIYKGIEDAVEAGGIDRAEFENEYGKELADKLYRDHKGLLQDGGEVTLGDLADSVGLKNPDELLAVLERLAPKEDAIKSLAAEKSDEAEARILTDIKRKGKDGLGVLDHASEEYYISEARLMQRQLDAEKGKNTDVEDVKQEMRDKLAEAKETLKKNSIEWKMEVNAKRDQIRESKQNLRNLRFDGTTLEALKDIADEEIRGATVADAINPKKYQNDVISLDQEVRKALTKGDGEEAARLQKEKLIAHYKAKAAMDAIAENAKYDRLLNEKKLARLGGNLDLGYRTVLGDLMSEFGLETKKLVDATTFNDDMKKNPLQWLFNQDAGIFGDIAPWIREGQTRHMDSLTLDEKQDVYTAAKAIIGLGREDSEAALAARRQNTLDAVADTLKYGEKYGQVGYNENGTTGAVLQDFARSSSSYTMPFSIRFSMINGEHQKKTGELKGLEQYSHLMGTAASAKNELIERVYKKHMNDVMDHLVDEGDRLRKELKADRNGRFQIPGLEIPKRIRDAGFKSWSADDVFGFCLHCGNDGNLMRLLKGYGLGPDAVQKVWGVLSERGARSIEKGWASTEDLRPELEKMYLEQHGERPKWIEAQPFKVMVRDGKEMKEISLTGGYAPAIHDPVLKKRLFNVDESTDNDFDVQQQHAGTVMPRGVAENRFQRRSSGTPEYPLNLSFNNLLVPHIEWTARYLTLQEPVRQLGYMLRNPDMAAYIKKAFGDNFYSETLKSVADTANPYTNQTNDNKAFSMIRSGLQRMMGSSAILSLNMHPASQRISWGISVLNSIRWADQVLGVGKGFQYFSEVQKDLQGWDKLNANLNTPLLRQTSLYQKVMEKSQYMRNRENENVAQFRDVFNDIYGKTNIRFKIGDRVVNLNEAAGIGARLMNLTDMSINMPAWDAVYRGYMAEKGLAKIQAGTADQGTVEKEAVALADKCVFETQPLSSRENASQFMRDKKNILNMMFLFRSYSSFAAGRTAAMFKEMKAGVISKEEYASHVGIDMFMEPMAQVAFRTLWTGQKFATPIFAGKLILAPIAAAMGGVGGTLGMVASDWLRKMIGADKNEKIKINPDKALEDATELPFIKDIKKPFKAIGEFQKGGIHTERGVMDMLDGLNFYYGLGGGTPYPAENLWREFQGMRNMMNVANPDKGKQQ